MKKVLLFLIFTVLSLCFNSCATKTDIVKEPRPAIIGTIYDENGVPLEGAAVSVYLSNANLFHGPDNYRSNYTDKTGAFSIDIPEGSYYLVARKRMRKELVGPLTSGDYNGEYPNNPVKVISGNTVEIQIVSQKLEGLMLFSPMTAAKNLIQIKGMVKDEKGKLLSGMYVIGYIEATMGGKPDFISQPTNIKGEFILSVNKPGKYYLGAKQVFKKPPVKGELVGFFDGTKDHSIEFKDEKGLENIEIVVHPYAGEKK
ncbi:MAG: carboxypeptidase regulatory-like domain-containing protein [Candidatus Firestonebacteria bacterium]|nr:carboxypeptidase regulatory-like domain-containing protein [Candidatus Firestonebacteria bacterium]